MTSEEEAAFRLAVRQLIQDGGDEGGDIVIVRKDQPNEESVFSPFPDFSLLLFQDGRRGILVPHHLGVEPDADERFMALMRQEASAAGAGYALEDSRRVLN